MIGHNFCLALAATTTLFAANAFAQAPPTSQGLTYLNSTIYPGASISFKETTICETTEGVKGWSGYVNLPPSPQEGRNYPIHTWFWFFEARNDPANAPLSLWLQGGPGAPTSVSAVNENGPCNLLNNSRDSVLNQWSWNDKVNMLYIDQPVMTGFSYDSLINGTISEALSPFAVLPAQVPKNDTSLAGVFSTGNKSSAPNNTLAAASPMWDFMQIWLKEYDIPPIPYSVAADKCIVSLAILATNRSSASGASLTEDIGYPPLPTTSTNRMTVSTLVISVEHH
jgi:hypothetical protein